MAQRRMESSRLKRSQDGPDGGARRRTVAPNRHLMEWGERHRARGVPIPLLCLAFQTAEVADVLQTAIELSNSECVRQLGPALSPAVWESLYRRGDQLFERLGNTVSRSANGRDLAETEVGLGTVLRHVGFSTRIVKKSTPDLVRQALAALKTDESWHREIAIMQEDANRTWNEQLDELRRNQELPLPDDSVMQSPEMQFFFRVWWVCWSLYGQSANALFDQAVTGDITAFEKLVRIDDRFLRIPRISDQLEQWRLDGNQNAREMVGAALSGKPLRATARQEKLKVIALLFRLSRELASVNGVVVVTFQLEQLRDLFDAVARDRGLVRDDDLPESDEAFRKAVKRAQAEQSANCWDIFSRKSVR